MQTRYDIGSKAYVDCYRPADDGNGVVAGIYEVTVRAILVDQSGVRYLLDDGQRQFWRNESELHDLKDEAVKKVTGHLEATLAKFRGDSQTGK